MKKSFIAICLLALSLQLCSQQGWVPQRSKYYYRDSVRFELDVNVLSPLRLQSSFRIGNTLITSNGTELNILDGALVNATELNYLVGVTSGIQTQINTKAPSASPTFTGTVVLPSTTSIGLVSSTEIGWLDDVSSSIQTQLNGKAVSGHNHSGIYEPVLGNPSVDGYVLSSTTGGARSWVAQGGIGGGMTYPGAGIALSTGSSWATSITDNSTNWNTAYGWGNHASAGYLTSQTSHADVVVDGDFTGQGIMLRGASSGVYSILGDNSSNWNTAYSWGNHAAGGYFVGTSSTIRSLLSSSATGLTYTNSTGVFSLTSGYVIPSTIEQSNWNTAYGWGNHASAGYVPTSRTVNGHALTSNVSVTATDVSLGNVTNESKATMFTSPTFTGTPVIPSPFTLGSTSMTSSATELNILDGATFSTTELNYVDGVTSNIQTQLDDTIDLRTVIKPKYLTINSQTNSYTLVLTDDSKLVTMNVGSANNLTIPPNSSVAFPTGTQIDIAQTGSGKTSFVAGSGVTIGSPSGNLALKSQYSQATIRKIDTNTWLLSGDLEAGTSSLWTGLRAGWSMNETGGTSVADYLSTYAGTTTGAVGQTGKLSYAETFTRASTQYATFGNTVADVGTSDFSVSCWIYCTTVSSQNMGILGQCGDSPYFYLKIANDDNKLHGVVNFGSGNIDTESNSTISATTWYHVVYSCTRSGNAHLYVNSVDQTDVSDISAGSSTSLSGDNVFYIGTIGSNYTDYTFNGSIDDVYLFFKALSSTEVSNIYNSGTGKTYPN